MGLFMEDITFRMSWMMDMDNHCRFFLLGKMLCGMHCFIISKKCASHFAQEVLMSSSIRIESVST